jgi:predicted ester cyclase
MGNGVSQRGFLSSMELLFGHSNAGQDGTSGPVRVHAHECKSCGTLQGGEKYRNTTKTLLPVKSRYGQRGSRRTIALVSSSETSNGEPAVIKDEAWDLARHWVAAWNAHDLDVIMTHYDEAVELTSPVAAQLLKKADGKVVGKANLRAYFQRGLQAYPDLQFRLEDVLWGINSVILYYTNQKGTRTGEFMELSTNGKVIRVVANYNA